MTTRFVDILVEIDDAASDEEAARMALHQLRNEEVDMVVTTRDNDGVSRFNSTELEE